MIETSTNRADRTESSHLPEVVVDEVAATLGKSPLELPPLYDVIDPDALEQLFDGHRSDNSRSIGLVKFTYDDCVVVVHGTGEVRVTPIGDHDRIEP